MKSKVFIIALTALLVVVGGAFVARLGQTTQDSGADEMSYEEAAEKAKKLFGDDMAEDSSGDSGEMVNVGELIEDVGLMIMMSKYEMEGPIHMRIRKDANDIDVSREGQGYYVRTTEDDKEVENAFAKVEERLFQLGFNKKDFRANPDVNNVLSYTQFTSSPVTCVFEKKQIGSTGNMDITIGCFE